MSTTYFQGHHGLRHAPLWAILALILTILILAASQLLDGPDDIETARAVGQEASAARQAAAPNLAEAIRMACASHGAAGRVNRFGDIQCHDRNGRPTFYVYVWKQQP